MYYAEFSDLLCKSAFLCYEKIPEKIRLTKEKVYFGSVSEVSFHSGFQIVLQFF
jgi:hypothetical protein